MNKIDDQDKHPTYRIGVVSRMTGVAQDTLRIWERRYGAVIPMRSAAGTRLYSQTDISRLTLIKRLIDQGDAISRVAKLELAQLQQRIAITKPADVDEAHSKVCRVAVIGEVVGGRLEQNLGNDEDFMLLGPYDDKHQFVEEASKQQIDLLILEYATLQYERVKEIGMLLQRSGVSKAVLAYGFASSDTLVQLKSDRIIPIRMPIDINHLKQLCRSLHARRVEQVAIEPSVAEIAGGIPAKLFTDAQLAKVAAASVSVRCECPHHLVDLIIGLSAFETYSQECEVLNIEDAALHALLSSATAQARSLVEQALEKVIEIDGLDIR
jgi:DNA-binding transcriptional MerR regulator